MRLIEVAGFIDRIEDRDATHQESRRKSGALDLADCAMADSGRAQEVTLCGSDGQACRLTPQRSLDIGVANDDPLPYEPGHEGVRILGVRVFPRGALQP